MIKRHMNKPRTKLETEAETMELAMTKRISPIVTGSSGWSKRPKRTEKTPAIEPEISAWT